MRETKVMRTPLGLAAYVSYTGNSRNWWWFSRSFMVCVCTVSCEEERGKTSLTIMVCTIARPFRKWPADVKQEGKSGTSE